MLERTSAFPPSASRTRMARPWPSTTSPVAGWCSTSTPRTTPRAAPSRANRSRPRGPISNAAGISVVGVSQDDVASHKSFCDKFSFTIDLLADPEATLLKAAGITQSEWKGTMYWNRTSFVIDPSGVLRKVYENVKPDGHEKVLLDDIKALQAAS